MERVKFKNIVSNVIILAAIGLFALIALVSIFKSGPASIKMPFYSGLVFLLPAAVSIIICYRFNLFSKIKPGIFLALLIIVALIPRLLWIHYVQTQPFSDFLHMHNYGINASEGNFKGFVNFYAVFPFKMGFGLVLAGLYSIFGSNLIVAKLFNVVLSLILVVIVYEGSRMLYGDRAARTAGLLMALWPADIMYTSVIASEHLFLVLFTGAVLLMLRFIKKYTYKNYKTTNGNLLVLTIGLLTACAQLIRPMAMLLLPVFAVFVLLYKRYRANSLMGLGLSIKTITLLLVSYFAIINLINIPVQKVTGVDITQSDSGFNLLIGTNSKYNGAFNKEDFEIIDKNNYDIDKVHKEAKKIAIDRLKTNTSDLPRLFTKKFEILWGNENYGYYWSAAAAGALVGASSAEKVIKSYPRLFYGVSQAFYVLIILMSICACIYSFRAKRYDSLIILMIFGAIVLSYTLLEVQSRYHLPVMPLLILFSTSFLPGTKNYDI